MKKHTNTVILWLIAIGLLLGMIITFTPNLGFGGGGGTTAQGDVVLRVNGEPVTDLQINQLRNANPIYYAVSEGEVGQDLQLLALDAVISQELLRQAAASQRVSNGEIRAAVDEFREERGVAGGRNDNAYLQLISGAGFDDAAFRAYMGEQLRQQKWEASIIGDVTVSDEEVRTYFDAFGANYRTDERIVARAITVADQELANELRSRVLTGEDFATLAGEYSTERADRGGALGASADDPEPQPVGRAVLPAAVSSAAFNLRAPGLTSVITASGLYYLVQVEEYIAPEPVSFEDVEATVREDALNARQVGLVSAELERLVAEADIEMVDTSEFNYDNYVVATVGNEEIRAADLARATYGNAEVQQFLDPSLSFLITQMLKPQLLEQLIDQKAALIGSRELDGSFFGTESQIAMQALNYVTRDVTVTEDEISAYYDENIDNYTQQREAQTVRYEFPDFDSAEAFRDAVVAGTTPTDAAVAAGIVGVDMGVVRPGLSEVVIDSALFGTDAFETIDGADREISDVLFIEAEEPAEDEAADEAADEEAAADDEAADEADLEDASDEAAEDVDPELAAEVADAAANAAAEVLAEDDAEVTEEVEAEAEVAEAEPEVAADRYVVLVAARTEERVRPLDEVHDLVETAVLSEKRVTAQQEWLDGVKEGLDIENLSAAAAADPLQGIDFSPEEVTGLPAADEAAEEPVDGAAADEAAAEDEAADDADADDADEAEAQPADDEGAEADAGAEEGE